MTIGTLFEVRGDYEIVTSPDDREHVEAAVHELQDAGFEPHPDPDMPIDGVEAEGCIVGTIRVHLTPELGLDALTQVISGEIYSHRQN